MLDGLLIDYEKPAETSSLYDRAADEIEKRGWYCAGHDRYSNGLCILGALGAVGAEDQEDCARQMGFINAYEAFHWNDDQPSPAPVIARLRAAARAERGE